MSRPIYREKLFLVLAYFCVFSLYLGLTIFFNSNVRKSCDILCQFSLLFFKVTNTLSVNVSVYYMTLSGNEVRLLGDVPPGEILRLPLQAVHTPTAEIFFSVEGKTLSRF